MHIPWVPRILHKCVKISTELKYNQPEYFLNDAKKPEFNAFNYVKTTQQHVKMYLQLFFFCLKTTRLIAVELF